MSEYCRRGPRCPFLAKGTCNFFHSGVEVQQQRRSQGGWQESPRGPGVSEGPRRLAGVSGAPQEPRRRPEADSLQISGGLLQSAVLSLQPLPGGFSPSQGKSKEQLNLEGSEDKEEKVQKKVKGNISDKRVRKSKRKKKIYIYIFFHKGSKFSTSLQTV